MRSRYSAFVEQQPEWLMASWHPQTRPVVIDFNPDQKWIGLKIVSTSMGGENDLVGQVEFIARFKISGKAYRLHERSRFEKLNNRWVYLDGLLLE